MSPSSTDQFRSPIIDVTSLRYALLVLEHGSFRRVADALGVRPSVVSRRVRAFEDAIGVSLFQRQSRGAEPTVAGRRLLRSGRFILDELEHLFRVAALSSSGSEGRLCLGVVSSIAGGKARDLLRAFLTAHPNVELDVVEGSPRDHVAAVRALRMDVTFVVGALPAAGCEVEPLWSEPIMVALPSSHLLANCASINWDQLAGERFIVSKVDPGPEIHDYIVQHLAHLGRHPVVEPRPVWREGLMAMVGLGLGVSLVGAAEAAVAYPGATFRPIDGELLPFSAVWCTSNDNPVLRRFLSLARVHSRRLSGLPPAPRPNPSSASDAPSRTPDRSP